MVLRFGSSFQPSKPDRHWISNSYKSRAPRCGTRPPRTDPSAPLRTFDAAAQWLDDIGFCLFLPRHTQLPAPAPSFVEACLGAPSVTPAPAVIAEASELLTRLVGERRIVPLNLLGAFSEQPDFLVTPEVLPWVAAVRGDRQWKTAPGGRTSPIVIRTFEALDREGELTAIEVREIVGNAITEAAALRALMELWTGLRAMPIAALGEPTRWTLLKNRFAAQLATAANTSQTTALSAVLSLYLRSAVAATAEETEIFLSPLTARSRIREVLHGMMATAPARHDDRRLANAAVPGRIAARNSRPAGARTAQANRPAPAPANLRCSKTTGAQRAATHALGIAGPRAAAATGPESSVAKETGGRSSSPDSAPDSPPDSQPLRFGSAAARSQAFRGQAPRLCSPLRAAPRRQRACVRLAAARAQRFAPRRFAPGKGRRQALAASQRFVSPKAIPRPARPSGETRSIFRPPEARGPPRAARSSVAKSSGT